MIFIYYSLAELLNRVFCYNYVTSKISETSGSSFIWLTKPPSKLGENMEINNTNVKYYSNQEDDDRPEMTSQMAPESRDNQDSEHIQNSYSGVR